VWNGRWKTKQKLTLNTQWERRAYYNLMSWKLKISGFILR
jgi:hypothetical protein